MAIRGVIPGTGASNLGKSEDAAHSSGDVGVPAMTVRQNTAAALGGSDGDYQPLITDSSGRLHTTIGSLPASTNTIEIVGDVAENANAAGNPVLTGGRYDATPRTLGNTDVGAFALDADGALHIADGGNTITVDGTVTASNTAGDIAHDATDSGNPIKIGGKAYNLDGTAPGTAVAENDRVHFIGDVYGRQFVETVHPCFWKATDNQSSAQTDTALVSAPGSGLSLYVTDIIISNGATAGNVKLVEDTASAADIVEVMYFAVNGGAVINLKTPLKLTANKDLGYTSVDCTTHSITVSGFTAP